MAYTRPTRLDRPVDLRREHFLGNTAAEMTLVEYGSYACPSCGVAHEVVANLRDRFGDRMLYVFRQLPITGSDEAQQAAELAEYAAATNGQFWTVHDVLMKRGPAFAPGEIDRIAVESGLPPPEEAPGPARRAAQQRVQDDIESARRSGAFVTPTFFINNRRYEGAWDESALGEAMLGSLGHRLHTATLDFVRWGPSAGFLLLLMSLLAVVIANSPAGEAFASWLDVSFGLQLGATRFALPLLDWINHGLLSVFFLVVGLEIKREFTIGRLATRRAAALPIAAAIGGMIAPALIFLAVVPLGPLSHGWGIPIATDTAFAIALIVLLGDRVPVELRVFLTAAVIVDDLVVIVVLALFYAGQIDLGYVAASAAATAALIALNRSGIYRALPYAVLGIALWVCLYASGLHATLAGVILAAATPTRPPANLRALMAQAETVMQADLRSSGEHVLRHGPSEPALRALDVIHDQIESPASKLLRSVEPWSSYVVLPVFALANAGVMLSFDVVQGNAALILAIVLGLVVGKPAGIVLAAWLAVRFGIAVKPAEYTWRQLSGAGILAGIGFTMSLFIATHAFSAEAASAAKIAIFLASFIAGGLGTLVLWRREEAKEGSEQKRAAGT